MTTIREGTFYPVWPVIDGKPINYQWGEIRSNTAETKALVRQSVQELEDGVDELNALRALLGQEYGDLDFRNKYRIFYDQDTEELCIQKNDGTVDAPIWTDSLCIRFHDGQVQVVSTGGIQSSAGFYGSGLQSIQEVAESGSEADVSITNPTKIFFNTDDGLAVEEISSGANKGQPEVRFTAPFGKAEQFTKSGKVWQVDHNFGVTPVLVQVMDNSDRVIIPDKADVSDPNTAWFYFNEVFSGSVYIASGGVGAASLVPKDPFYLVARTDDTPAAPGNTLKPNADLIFDSDHFYVNVDLDADAGGAHKKAYIHLNGDVADKDHGNLVGLSDDDHTQYILADGTRAFSGDVDFGEYNLTGIGIITGDNHIEGSLTAEAFYLASGGDLSDHGSLSGLSDDDHAQYILADGSRRFSGNLVLMRNLSDDSNVLYIDSGLTTSQQSQVIFQDQSTSKWILTKDASNRFRVYDAVENFDVIRITSHADNEYAIGINSGNVGIGTANPSKKLHVVGEGYFTKHVRMDDTLNVENAVTAEAFYLASGGQISVSDHGDLTGLSDDDHTQYILADGTRAFSGHVRMDDTLNVENAVTAEAFYLASGGDLSDHGSLNGLSDDDHTQYILADGSRRFTGNLVLMRNLSDDSNVLFIDSGSTAAQQSQIQFQDQSTTKWILTKDASNRLRVYDSAESISVVQITSHADNEYAIGINSGNLGVGTASPSNKLHVVGDGYFTKHVRLDDTLNVENAVTAEAFYIESGGNIYSDGGQLALRSDSSNVLIKDDLSVENTVIAEAFYLASGGEVSKDGVDLIIDSGGGEVNVRDDLHVGEVDASGDSVIDFKLGGSLQFRLGVDDSDSDSFKLADSTGFGSGDILRISQAGKFKLSGVIDSLDIENSVRAEAFYFEGGGEVPRSYVKEFTSSVEWTVNHNLGRSHFIAQAYKGTGELLTPDAVYANDKNVTYFYFADAHAGKAVIFGVG